jgi:hypothetical protein
MSEEKTEAFGPFTNIPSDAIELTGFACRCCKRPVRRFKHPVPGLVPRVVFHSCDCGSVATWEDESQPNPRIWKLNVKLMKRTGAEVLFFNGDKPLTREFSGLN